jgi:hypothetical protein
MMSPLAEEFLTGDLTIHNQPIFPNKYSKRDISPRQEIILTV